MKLIHMSDIHLTTPGSTIGGRDPRYNFERALGHFATWCAAQRCALGSDRTAVLASVKRLLTDLDAHPLPAATGRPPGACWSPTTWSRRSSSCSRRARA